EQHNRFERQPGHIIDLMPTMVELAGAKYPSEFHGNHILPMEGRSLVPAFQGKPVSREAIYWEHEGSRAVGMGRWEAVAVEPQSEWEWYHRERDRSEMHNRAAQDPDRVLAMRRQWKQWARRTHAIPWIWSPQYREVQ